MKKIILVSCLLLVSSCAATHGAFLSDKQDAWIDGYGADRGLLFCRANVKENGLADPICFETRFEEYEDEQEKVEKENKNKKKN